MTRYLEAMGQVIDESNARIPRISDSLGVEIYKSYVQSRLPQTLRGAYLTALWALYESTVLDIGTYLGKELFPKARPLKIRRNFAEEADKFYETTLSIPRTRSDSERNELARLYRLRNAFAHSSGRTASIRATRLVDLESDQQNFGGFVIENGRIEVSDGLVYHFYNKVQIALYDLIARARERWSEVCSAPAPAGP